jgi:hypothetical protein
MDALAADATNDCEAHLNTHDLGQLGVHNVCAVRYGPGQDRSLSMSALVPAQWVGEDGKKRTSTRVYEVECAYTKDETIRKWAWKCTGAFLDTADTTVALSEMEGVEVTSLNGSAAFLKWGEGTFIVDAQTGMIEYRDAQGARGTAQCHATYRSQEDADRAAAPSPSATGVGTP